MVRVLARFREILEARVRGRIGEDLRPDLLGHEAGEALGEPHPHAADAFSTKADRGGKHQVRAIGLEQVHRADVGLEPLLDQMDDVRQRLGRVAALRDEPSDFFEGPEQGSFARDERVADAAHYSL